MEIRKSLRFKLIVGFIAIVTPLVGFLFYNNIQAVTVVREEVAQSNKNLLTVHFEKIDNELRDATEYLFSLAVADPNVIALRTSAFNGTEYYFAEQHLLRKMSSDIDFFPVVDSLFIYTARDRDLITTETEYEKSTVLREHIARWIETDERDWQLIPFKEQYALVRMITNDQEVFTGVWVDVGNVTKSLDSIDLGEYGEVIVTTLSGKPLTPSRLPADSLLSLATLTEEKNKPYEILEAPSEGRRYLVVRSASLQTDIQIAVLIPEEHLLQRLLFFQQAIYWIPVGAVVILIVFILFLRSVLLQPLRSLIRGMRNITQGNLKVRLEEKGASELSFLIRSFNDMVAQIDDLKIHVYEEKLRTQKAEFDVLQVQISPHFYLNTLNIAYHLSAMNRNDLVQNILEHLADYFRFIMRANRSYITLMEELRHIENYLEIQKHRFPGKLAFRIELPDVYKPFLIPPLVIQPFVENAIIHGFQNRNQPFDITVSVTPDPAQPESSYVVRIEDNGVGFSDEALNQLKSDDYDYGSKHLGIRNVCTRLRMKYGGEAGVTYENAHHGGAMITVRLPIQSGGEETDV